MPTKSESAEAAAPFPFTSEQVAAIAQVVGVAMAGTSRVPVKVKIPEKSAAGSRAAEDPANFAGSEGWKRFRATCTAAPVYLEAVSKDGQYLYAPRFRPGQEVLVPLDAQTERYVRFNQLELVDTTTHYVPAAQGEEGHFITGKKK